MSEAARETWELGYCPLCGARGESRERTPGGNDECEQGHIYPSRFAVDLMVKSLFWRAMDGFDLNDLPCK